MTKSRRVTSGERLYLALSDARVADYFVHEFMCRLAIRLPGCDLAVSEERRVAIAAKRAWMKGDAKAYALVESPLDTASPLLTTARLTIAEACGRTSDREVAFQVATLAASHHDLQQWSRWPEMGLPREAPHAHNLAVWRKVVQSLHVHQRAARWSPAAQEAAPGPAPGVAKWLSHLADLRREVGVDPVGRMLARLALEQSLA